MGTVRKLFSFIKGFSDSEQSLLRFMEEALVENDFKESKRGVRDGSFKLVPYTLDEPGATIVYPQVTGAEEKINETLKEYAYKQAYTGYSTYAFEDIKSKIAPNIVGFEAVKQAVTLQLFANERLHILLLGDPGTGKTDILRSANELAEISVMGLGSGTSKAGLSAAYVKGELMKGLLPLADKGLACIDELNLMKKDDRASLYNAMEKGFISVSKGGSHEEFKADVRVLATANPKGDNFSGTTISEIRKELPFAPALVSRFHLQFLIRKPGTEEFVKIAKKIASQTKKQTQQLTFAKQYIAHTKKLTVTFPSNLEPLVTEASKKIKEQEDDLLIEVSPRVVKGIIGFSKASARSRLASTVEEKDVKKVLSILGASLKIEL